MPRPHLLVTDDRDHHPTQNKRNFVERPPSTGQATWAFRLADHLPVAEAAVAGDPRLQRLRFSLVPLQYVVGPLLMPEAMT